MCVCVCWGRQKDDQLSGQTQVHFVPMKMDRSTYTFFSVSISSLAFLRSTTSLHLTSPSLPVGNLPPCMPTTAGGPGNLDFGLPGIHIHSPFFWKRPPEFYLKPTPDPVRYVLGGTVDHNVCPHPANRSRSLLNLSPKWRAGNISKPLMFSSFRQNDCPLVAVPRPSKPPCSCPLQSRVSLVSFWSCTSSFRTSFLVHHRGGWLASVACSQRALDRC